MFWSIFLQCAFIVLVMMLIGGVIGGITGRNGSN